VRAESDSNQTTAREGVGIRPRQQASWTHRGPLREPRRFVTQHAQSAVHKLHTSSDKGGCGERRDTRQHFCDRVAQWRTGQPYTAADRVRALESAASSERSRCTEWGLALYRKSRTSGKMAPGRPGRRANTTAAAVGRRLGGALRQRGWHRNAAAWVVEPGLSASSTGRRPIASVISYPNR